ncbi:glutamyl aminopeptidase-like protein [Aphelenchoides avenae]|nr:glutamyl aminopeptidase-like protein [Aphelenchus avenae]
MAYTKGAAILEMLNSTIGPWMMRRLLRDYLREYSFQAAETGDFLDLLQSVTEDMEESGPVEFLTSWLYQGSHPIVFVDYNPQLRQFVFSQRPKIGPLSLQWHVPIWIDNIEGTTPERLFWIPAGVQLVLDLDELTLMNDTEAVAFNRTRAVYYELSFRY